MEMAPEGELLLRVVNAGMVGHIKVLSARQMGCVFLEM